MTARVGYSTCRDFSPLFRSSAREERQPVSRVFLYLAGVLAVIGIFSEFRAVVYSGFLLLVFAYVLRRPYEGGWCLVLTLTVAASVFPWDVTGEFGGDAPESFWYWGVGLIAVGAAMTLNWMWHHLVLGLPRQALVRPRSEETKRLKWVFVAFASVVAVASLHGYRLGNSPSVIARQGAGLLLLFVFVYLGIRFSGTQRNMLQTFARARLVVLVYSVVFVIRHVLLNLELETALPVGDFARERSPILFFAGLFAALSVWEVLFDRRKISVKQAATVLALFLAGLFSGSRAIMLATLATVAFGLVLRHRKHPGRIVLWSTPALLLIALNPLQLAISLSEGRGFIDHMVQRFVVSPSEDFSFVQRVSQMISVSEVIRDRPLLGNGVGGTITWFEPSTLTTVETAFVDNGVGYLLLKLGLLGTLVFGYLCWLLWKNGYRLLVEDSRASAIPLTASLVFYCAYMPFGPSFFQFFTTPWIGLVFGYLLATRTLVDLERRVREQALTSKRISQG